MTRVANTKIITTSEHRLLLLLSPHPSRLDTLEYVFTHLESGTVMKTVCRGYRVPRSTPRIFCRVQPCVHSLQGPVQLLTLETFPEVMAALHSKDSSRRWVSNSEEIHKTGSTSRATKYKKNSNETRRTSAGKPSSHPSPSQSPLSSSSAPPQQFQWKSTACTRHHVPNQDFPSRRAVPQLVFPAYPQELGYLLQHHPFYLCRLSPQAAGQLRSRKYAPNQQHARMRAAGKSVVSRLLPWCTEV